MVGSGGSARDAEAPEMPEGLLDELKGVLSEEEAPFLRHLGKHLTLEWL